jgi:electron transfer flavoprotein alpha subunit
MSVLLIAEHNNKELKPFTLNAITAASQIDQDVHAVIIGHNSEQAVKCFICFAFSQKSY